MSAPLIVDQALLDGLSVDAALSPRRRKNRNFHAHDADGGVTQTVVLGPDGAACGVNIPHGVFHSVFACAPGTVFFEAKAGPYLPLGEAERAAWAPAEGDAGAAAYAESLRRLFGSFAD